MKFADLVKDATTSTGTGAITLSGTPATGFQSLSAVGGTGSTFPYSMSGGAEWEIGIGTITGANTFTRAPTASSNGGALVNFSAGTKTVVVTMTASLLSRIPIDRDVAFSQTVPLDQVGIAWMTQQSVSAKYTFTPAAGAVKGASASGRLVADGVTANAPDTSAFKTISGTAAYNNVAGSVNLWEASYDGYNYWWAWAQEGSTSSGATTPTVTGVTVSPSTANVAGSANQTFTATVTGTNSPSQSVTWSASAGSITSGGVFTAPAATGSTQTITVTATSVQDGATTGTATVTVAAATGSYPRLQSLSATTTESGSGPYTYTGGGTALASETGGISTLGATSDLTVDLAILAAGAEIGFGLRTVQSGTALTNYIGGFYATGGSGSVPAAYRHVGGANLGTTPQTGDVIRYSRTGSSATLSIQRNGTGSFTVIDTITGISTAKVYFGLDCCGTTSAQLLAWTGFA
jgi:uncharacterized protein YjdB